MARVTRSCERSRRDVLLRDVASVAHRAEDAVGSEQVERRCGREEGRRISFNRRRQPIEKRGAGLTIVFGHFAGIHDQDAVAVDDGTESVGDDEQGFVAELFADGRLDARVGRKIDRSRRFAATVGEAEEIESERATSQTRTV